MKRCSKLKSLVRDVILVAIIISFCNVSLAASNSNNTLDKWQYSKDILITGENLYKSVVLDEEVYRYANDDLSDIRIVDDNNDFVPYYIRNSLSYKALQKKTYSSKLVVILKSNTDKSAFDFKITANGSPPNILIDTLSFTLSSNEYIKNIDIYGGYDGKQWSLIMSDTIFQISGSSKNFVIFNKATDFNYYKVKIKNNDDNTKVKDMQASCSFFSQFKESITKTSNLEFNEATKDQNTYIDILNSNRLKIFSIDLNIDGIFNRKYEVYTKSGKSVSSFGVKGSICNFSSSDISVNATTINLIDKPIYSDCIEILVSNLDDPPLNIKNIRVVYYLDEIVFEYSNRPKYKLYFGNLNCDKPTYDIVSYQNFIDQEKRDRTQIGSLVHHLIVLPKQENPLIISGKSFFSWILSFVFSWKFLSFVGPIIFIFVFKKIKMHKEKVKF